MPLTAQRFQGNDTLRRCVDEGYRMYYGEPDREAVKRLQFALDDLGYPDITRIDGEWGDRTSAAVVAFKTDEYLQPADPVASSGTIGQLDAYFAWEPAWPDDPDPSAYGLTELAEETAATAASYAEECAAVLDTLAWGEPASSPDEDPVRSALRTHVGLDAGDESGEAQGAQLWTVLSAIALWSGPEHR